MPMLERISIRHKLAILLGLSAALALLISSVATIYSTYLSESRASLRVLHQLTDVISENMRAALAFNDADSARKILASLQADPHILYAVVSDDRGQPLGEYRSTQLPSAQEDWFRRHLQNNINSNRELLRREGSSTQHMDSHTMGVLRPVFFEGKPIGTLAIISDTQQLWARIQEFVLMQMGVSLLALLTLMLLSFKLQSLFTRPIMGLIDAMQQVARTKDYRTTLESRRQDEFGNLYAGFNAMLADIRERDERLSRLATTDSLTGLANHHQAMETMQNMIIRAERKGESLGVIMLDIDFFKAVNDRHGHPVGDRVLQEIARVLQACAREYDLVARLGGEEFLVLCDGGTREITVAVAERIRTGIEQHPIEYQPGQFLQVTVSLGGHASVPQSAEQPLASMIKAADAALYRAKAAGRNCHVLA